MDIAEALTKTTNPRVYWATVKRRKDDPAVRKSAQLILENRDLRFPRVTLLNCRLRRNIVGVNDAEDLPVRLPQKICYCGGVVGS